MNYCKTCKHSGNTVESFPCIKCGPGKSESDPPSRYESAGDNVDHPAHYGRDGAIECIEEMIMVFGKESVKNFCICNAWKYRYRAADKNGAEDIAKSDWYMNKYKELLGNIN